MSIAMWNKISERMDKLEARIRELEKARETTLPPDKRKPGRPKQPEVQHGNP